MKGEKYLSVKCILANQKKVSDLTNLILQDISTLEKYTVKINEGKIELVGVADSLVASRYVIIDEKGIAYNLIVDNGILGLYEVA